MLRSRASLSCSSTPTTCCTSTRRSRQYAQAGLLSAGYFAIAWVAHTLAKYAVASEELAAQREIDLENMAQVSEHVIQDMQDGVLVVDGQGVIRQFNTRAERILGPLWGRRDVPLGEYAPALARRFEAWREDEHGRERASDMTLTRAMGARFVPVGRRRSAGAVIFLEDLTRIQAEARQMKLAALGRLTANIAHEIRNPLGAISHAAELLQEEPGLSETTQAAHHDHPGQQPAARSHGERRAAAAPQRQRAPRKLQARRLPEDVRRAVLPDRENQAGSFQGRVVCRSVRAVRSQPPEPGHVEPVPQCRAPLPATARQHPHCRRDGTAGRLL